MEPVFHEASVYTVEFWNLHIFAKFIWIIKIFAKIKIGIFTKCFEEKKINYTNFLQKYDMEQL